MTEFSEAAARVDSGADSLLEARALVELMTTDEKLGCLDGDMPFWPGLLEMVAGGYTSRTWPAAVVERLGVPGLQFVDGPRGCVVGPSTTFPVSMARGAAFDPDLERRIGEAIGLELSAVGATYTGAVCINLLRHPAWGRAQETYGEDPFHVGEMGVGLTVGLQKHVMACMKHFALNSMENARFSVNVTPKDRAPPAVYLPHFRKVADAGVASVMTAYNSVNGQWCGDSAVLLSEILRDEWGWKGFVITDFNWGMRSPIDSIADGLNVEMPFGQQRAIAVHEALENGDLDIADVENRVSETVATFLRFARIFVDRADREVLASPTHRALAREAASSSIVLLRNDNLLPLDLDAVDKIAVLGRLAAVANLGDGGSSNVAHTPDPVTPLQGISARFTNSEVVHSDDDVSICDGAAAVVVIVGFTKEDEGEYIHAGAADIAKQVTPPKDHPIVGLKRVKPDHLTHDEWIAERAKVRAEREANQKGSSVFSPGGDRTTLGLSAADEQLIEDACSVHDNVIVAVIAGSAVVMPWLDKPKATMMLWYAGSEGGTALADVLTGTEPGGRLPFAIPVREEDLVTFDFDAHATEVTYGLLHGQWWLDANQTKAHLPFGHGLSYAQFDMGQPSVSDRTVSVLVSNTSNRSGSTVVQVYGSVPDSEHERPPKRLIGFAKLHLDAGAATTAQIELDLHQLDLRLGGEWVTEDLPVRLCVGFDAGSGTALSL